MKRFINLLLVLAFALLQGIAPLAHAHIGGMEVRGVHLPGMQLQHGHARHDYCYADEMEESEFVLTAQGVQREDEPAASDALIGSALGLQVPVATVTLVPCCEPQFTLTLSTLPHLRPFPNAPPAALSL